MIPSKKVNQAGMALAEILVAAGLLGAFSLGVIKLTENMQKGQSTIQLQSEKHDAINMLKLQLSNTKSCEQTLKGLVVNASPVPVTQVKIGSDGRIVVDLSSGAGTSYGTGAAKINITSINLTEWTELSPPSDEVTGEGTAKLVFSFSKGSANTKGTYGADDFTRAIPLRLYVDKDRKVVSCMDSEGSVKASCEMLRGTLKFDAEAGLLSCTGLMISKTERASIATDGRAQIGGYDDAKTETLWVNGNTGITGDLAVTGKAGITGALEVTGTAVTGPLSANGDSLVSGSLQVTGAVTGASFSPSDARLKDNVVPVRFPLEVLDGIRGVTYTWNPKSGRKGMSAGVIAQELRRVLPHLVAEGKDGTLAVNYNGLVPYLIEGVKAEKARVQQLEDRLEKMGRKLDALALKVK